MKLFRAAKKQPNITKKTIGERVKPNGKANKIYEKAIKELKSTKRKWF